MKPPETKTEIFAGEGPDGEDIIKTFDTKTGAILKTEIITTDTDGKEVLVPLSAKKMEKMARPALPKPPPAKKSLPTVEDMIIFAEEMRTKASREEITELVSAILEECREHVLQGSHEKLFPQDGPVKAETIPAVVKHLKDLGYKVKKTPSPGEGTWIKISWPTKLKKQGRVATPTVVSAKPAQQSPTKKHLEKFPEEEMIMDFKKKPS